MEYRALLMEYRALLMEYRGSFDRESSTTEFFDRDLK